jgi:hypothetical protein
VSFLSNKKEGFEGFLSPEKEDEQVHELLNLIDEREQEAALAEPAPASTLSCLQSIYRNPLNPVPMRIRAAAMAIPFESPKLTAIANMSPEDSSARLEKAISRSGVRLLEAKGGE